MKLKSENQNIGVNWAVVHTITFGPGSLHVNEDVQTAAFFVTGVHPDAGESDVKDALYGAGLFFGDDNAPWKNYFLSPEKNWITGWRQEFDETARDRMGYEDLLILRRRDRRITLRLPPGIHLALTHAARSRGLSLNQIIVDALEEWQDQNGLSPDRAAPKVKMPREKFMTAHDKIVKQYSLVVTKIADYPVFFVELQPRRFANHSVSNLRREQTSLPTPKAVVEIQNGEARFVTWERSVTSGRFGEAELRTAVEEAVEEFILSGSKH